MLLWAIMQHKMVIHYRHFGTTYGSIFQGLESLFDLPTLENGIDRLSRNVGKELPLYAA